MIWNFFIGNLTNLGFFFAGKSYFLVEIWQYFAKEKHTDQHLCLAQHKFLNQDLNIPETDMICCNLILWAPLYIGYNSKIEGTGYGIK